MSSPDPQWFFYDNVRDHPYLHIFPRLQKEAHEEEPQLQEDDIAFSFREYTPTDSIRSNKERRKNKPVHLQPLVRTGHIVSRQGTYSGHHIRFGNNSTKGVLAQAVTEAMEEAKYPTAQPMPTLWGKNRIREWRLGDFLRSPAYATEDEPYDWFRSRDLDHVAPVTHWEFLHPQLPIIRVTSYNTAKLPLTVSSEDFSYKSLTDPNPNRSFRKLEI